MNMATSTAERIQLPVLLLSTVLVVLSASVPSCQAQPVLDADGDPVLFDGLYTLNPVGIGSSGGVTVFPSSNQTRCAAQVGLGGEADPGTVVVFIRNGFEPADGILKVSLRTRILMFRDSWFIACDDPWSWTTRGNSPALGSFTPIVAGLEQGSPPQTDEWFEARETGQARVYKLIYCSACLFCEVFCGAELGLEELGLDNVDGKTVLGVGGRSLRVRFMKGSPPTPAVAAK